MGPDRARIAAARALAHERRARSRSPASAPGSTPRSQAGDVVCATELVDEDGTRADGCREAPLLVAALRRRGLRVHVGPLASTDRILGPAERRAPARTALWPSTWSRPGSPPAPAAGRSRSSASSPTRRAGASPTRDGCAIAGPRGALRSLPPRLERRARPNGRRQRSAPRDDLARDAARRARRWPETDERPAAPERHRRPVPDAAAAEARTTSSRCSSSSSRSSSATSPARSAGRSSTRSTSSRSGCRSSRRSPRSRRAARRWSRSPAASRSSTPRCT